MKPSQPYFRKVVGKEKKHILNMSDDRLKSCTFLEFQRNGKHLHRNCLLDIGKKIIQTFPTMRLAEGSFFSTAFYLRSA